MDSSVLALLAASVSFVVYLGYVLLAGTGTFWAVVWPDGQAVRRLRIMAVVGLALIVPRNDRRGSYRLARLRTSAGRSRG